MSVLSSYAHWLEFVADLIRRPSADFPRMQIQLQLACTLDSIVSWNWEDPDGSYGFELSHPIEGWPTASDLEAWNNGGRALHPLLQWYNATEDPRPMSIGRVPRSILPRGSLEVTRDLTRPHGIDQQLSIPCQLGHGHRALVAAKNGDDFSEDAFQLSKLIQPLLALLWLQTAALERCHPQQTNTLGLTGRELAVLQLLAEGLTAEALARRLAISPRTVHSHLRQIYRKLGVCDRMRAVLVGQAAGVIAIGHRTESETHTKPSIVMWHQGRTTRAV